MKTFATQETILLTGEELLSLDEERIKEWVYLTGGLVGRVVNPPERDIINKRWNGWSAVAISAKNDLWKWVATTPITKKIAREASIKYFMKHGALNKKDASIFHQLPLSHKHKILPFIKLVLMDEYAVMAMLNYPCEEIELVNNWRRNWNDQIPKSLYALGKNEMKSLSLAIKKLAPTH